MLDGELTLSCVTPVWEAEGRAVTMVEWLAFREAPHPLQDDFDLKGAAQRGFCTPGILCSAVALLERFLDPTREQFGGASG